MAFSVGVGVPPSPLPRLRLTLDCTHPSNTRPILGIYFDGNKTDRKIKEKQENAGHVPSGEESSALGIRVRELTVAQAKACIQWLVAVDCPLVDHHLKQYSMNE